MLDTAKVAAGAEVRLLPLHFTVPPFDINTDPVLLHRDVSPSTIQHSCIATVSITFPPVVTLFLRWLIACISQCLHGESLSRIPPTICDSRPVDTCCHRSKHTSFLISALSFTSGAHRLSRYSFLSGEQLYTSMFSGWLTAVEQFLSAYDLLG